MDAAMLEWLWKIDVPSLLLGAVIGSVVSSGYNFFLKRPVIKITGGGGGGGRFRGFVDNHVTVKNVPGLFGITLEQTVFFGKAIHRRIEKGIPFERVTARECVAFIYQKETNEVMRQLWWRLPDGKYARKIDIESGENAHLMIFCRDISQKDKFFIFDYDPSNDGVRAPEDDLRLKAPMSFYVVIRYSYGKQKIQFDAKVSRDIDGRLHYIAGDGGGSF